MALQLSQAQDRRTSVAYWAAMALAMACFMETASAFAVGNDKAVLNKLIVQKTITQLKYELNPYGLAAITFNAGKLKAGNFLATQWNDYMNNPGQGHAILQVEPSGDTSVFANISISDPKITANCGNKGVGLTMALAILSKGYVLVGSTPIPINTTTALPGCLIVLDSNGYVLDAHAANETTTNGTYTGGGPWAFAVSESNQGSQASLFVSYVLGANASSTDTLYGAKGGMVVRYGLSIPGNNIDLNFWGKSPEVIASGFPTQPGNIGGGAVGPAGLFVSTSNSGSYYKDYLGQGRLFISNLLNNSIDVVPSATSCFSRGTPQCQMLPVAWEGLINQPIGIAQSPYGTVVGANGGIGTLFEVSPVPNANTQLADQLVDNTASINPPGAGTLFNVLFHPAIGNTLFFNDDGQNTYNTLKPASLLGNLGRKHML